MNRVTRRKNMFHPAPMIAPLIAIRGHALNVACLKVARDTMMEQVPEDMRAEFGRKFDAMSPANQQRIVRTMKAAMRRRKEAA